ncbi:MAG: hypothetical protein IJA91_01090, partial [Clostridia bacterium]|nr:hypothetical protein [Clostridia bacterium]
PTEAPTETPTEPPVTEPEEMTMEPKTTVAVIADGKTEYTIVAPAAVQEANGSDIAYLTHVMDAKFGTHPAVAESSTGKVISLAYADGESLNWSLIVDDATGNIELAGGGTVALSRAVQTFITQHCARSEGNLLVDVAGDYHYSYTEDKIDNSALLSYEGGDKTVLAPSDEDGELMTPAWLDSAVMVELRIDTASIGGTFKDSYDLIDFYAEAGVNVLWLSPVYERGAGGNGYGNIGPHRIEPWLTGTQDQEAGWNELKKFVDYAHSKGVYVLLDIITWGTMYASPLIEEHPDWYSGEAWGNAAFNWRNAEFKEWFITNAVANIEKTGADGYRCDCEPFTAGYKVYTEIRQRLNEKGIYPIIMSEEGGQRQAAFDCEQDGVLKYADMTRGQLYQNPVNFFVDGYLNIVDATNTGRGLGGPTFANDRRRMGTFRYYTNCITNHDYQERNVNGNRLKIGYAAIYAPYIPLWYMGDEFGVTMDRRAVLYDVSVDYGAVGTKDDQTLFFEDVKQMIAIRRNNPDLFAQWPLNHRDANIEEVKAEGLTVLQNYCRYAGNKMVIVLGNNEEGNDGICKVAIPFDKLDKAYNNYKVTDLLTGQVIAVGRAETVNNFSAIVPYEYCGVYMVEGIE